MDPVGFVFSFFQINPENFLAFRKVSVVKFAAQVKWSTGLPETAAFFPVGLGLGTSPKTNMDTQNGGLEKVDSFERWPFLVSMLDFWGVYFGTTPHPGFQSPPELCHFSTGIPNQNLHLWLLITGWAVDLRYTWICLFDAWKNKKTVLPNGGFDGGLNHDKK